MTTESRPVVHGSPGARARVAGLGRAALPLGIALLVAGYAIGAVTRLPLLGGTGLGWTLVVLAALLYAGCATSRRRVEAFFKGAAGEEIVARVLDSLPADHGIFHGVELPGSPWRAWRGADIDHVVVGPAGIAVVETKSWRGRVAIRDGQVLLNGVLPRRPPVAQARGEATALEQWLRARLPGLPPVRAFVCFAGEPLADGCTTVDGVTLCNAAKLPAALLQKSVDGSRLEPADRVRLIQILKEHV